MVYGVVVMLVSEWLYGVVCGSVVGVCVHEYYVCSMFAQHNMCEV